MSHQEFRPRQFGDLPVVVKNILIINIILFVASRYVFKSLPLDNYLDLHYYKSHLFKPYQFITYMFMHFDEMHIAFNMLGVYMFGSILENMWGSKQFINFYLLCGLGAAVAQFIVFYLQDQEFIRKFADIHQDMEQIQQFRYDNMICLGASGSLFGLLV